MDDLVDRSCVVIAMFLSDMREQITVQKMPEVLTVLVCDGMKVSVSARETNAGRL